MCEGPQRPHEHDTKSKSAPTSFLLFSNCFSGVPSARFLFTGRHPSRPFYFLFPLSNTFSTRVGVSTPRPSSLSAKPNFAAFSRSNIAPHVRQTATPGLIFSPHAGQSAIGFGSYNHGFSNPNS